MIVYFRLTKKSSCHCLPLQQQLVSLALALATLYRLNAVALVCNASSRNEFTITQRQHSP